MKPKLVMESRVEVVTKGNVKRTRAGKILLHNKTLRGRERKKRVLTHGKEDRNNKRESERDETSL